MRLVDHFICRREGHKPAAIITQTSGFIMVSYITQCMRCGKHIAYNPDGTIRKAPA